MNNGSEKVLRINDRGPYIKGRIIDVSLGAAQDMNFVNRGVVPVSVEVMRKIPTPPPAPPKPERVGLFASREPVRSTRVSSERNEIQFPEFPRLEKAVERVISVIRPEDDRRVASTSVGRPETRLRVRVGEKNRTFGLSSRVKTAPDQARDNEGQQEASTENQSKKRFRLGNLFRRNR